jgi:hypothetical protein
MEERCSARATVHSTTLISGVGVPALVPLCPARPNPSDETHRCLASESSPAWWAPDGFAVIPTTTIDPPHSAASPVVPALLGPGPHLKPSQSAGSVEVICTIFRNSFRNSGCRFSRYLATLGLPTSFARYPLTTVKCRWS